jgi:hypothetical protein
MIKQIVLTEGELPKLEGEWTVGEVMAAAETLSRWVQSFHVSGQSEPEKKQVTEADQ